MIKRLLYAIAFLALSSVSAAAACGSGSPPAGTVCAAPATTAGVANYRALADGHIPSGINATKIGGGAVSTTEFDRLDGVTAYGQSIFSTANEAAFKALVNLEIGVDVQAFDSDLSAIAALTTTAAGRSSLTFADPGVDRVMFWDDSANAMVPIAVADILTEAAPAAGDFLVIYGAEGDARKVNWSSLPGAGGGISAVVDDTSPQLGGALDTNGFAIEFGTAQTDTSVVRSAAGQISVEGVAVPTISSTNTLTNKTVDLTNNTLVGSVSEFNTALESADFYTTGGTDVALADGGTGASLTDPNADRLMFWDDSAGSTAYLTLGTGLTITGTTIDAAGGWTMITKTADTTRNSNTTLSADPDLQFTLAASTIYDIRIVVKGRTTATGDWKWNLTGPASPTEVYGAQVGDAGTGAAFEAYPASVAQLQGADGAFVTAIELTVENGVNSSAFAFGWAQNTSNVGPTTVKAGSYIEYRAR